MLTRLLLHFFRIGFLLLILLQSGVSYCQVSNPLDKVISVSLTNKNLKEILKTLKNKAGATFNYKSAILPKEELKLFEANNEKLSEILIRLLKPYNIEFKYFGEILLF